MNTPIVTMTRFVLSLLVATLLASAATGCRNTAHGVGEDVEKMGEKIQEKTD